MTADARKLRIVGVDAGGSKTEILLLDAEGRVLARALRGTGNPNDVGVDACADMMIDAIRLLMPERRPDAVFAGISGAGSGDNAERISKRLRDALGCAVEVGTDAKNLLAMGRSRAQTSALICGTGSALFFEHEGEVKRIGGWGYLFDRGGSAYDIGRDAICELLGAEDGTAPFGELCTLVKGKLGRSAHEALADIYAGGKAYVASFARCVFEARASGDTAAERIIEENIDALCGRLEALSLLYGASGELVCGGGLFADAYFCARLGERAAVLGFDVCVPTLPQSFGASVRAVALLGIERSESFESNFADSYEKYAQQGN